jgi:pimeloyl-ACP methyl ester carboxylesterase
VRTPLVLLPGMMCDARLFEPQISGLSDVAETWVGDLTRQDTMAALASAVLAEAPFERFALAGLSMGGIVALNMLARSPERIAGLALLGYESPRRDPRAAGPAAASDRARWGAISQPFSSTR